MTIIPLAPATNQGNVKKQVKNQIILPEAPEAKPPAAARTVTAPKTVAPPKTVTAPKTVAPPKTVAEAPAPQSGPAAAPPEGSEEHARSVEAGLSYARTVDRYLVHRESLGEVFLTDLQRIDEDRYAVAAQLPRSHAYYGDHLLRPNTYDPVLLLEACRQATLAGAHQFFEVPGNNKFILTHLTASLTHPRWITVGQSPFPLTMRVSTVDRKEREGRTTGIDSTIELSVEGTVLGRATVGLRFKTPSGYLALRLNNRDGAALPTSAGHPTRLPGSPVAPYLVGRTNPDNVVLVDAQTDGETARARLRIPADHPSMFDHAQDHLPGMVLVEAARQLALLTVLDARGVSAVKAFPIDLDAIFTSFGELEEDTVLTAELGEPRGLAEDERFSYTQGGVLDLAELSDHYHHLDPGTVADLLPVRVEARQGDKQLCVFKVMVKRIQAEPPTEGR
ncbi:ScbA/BarX family gamma-butyrolactone biosynthesis protein [Kitasatospora sp. NPDC056783]|uniref:ScbA/BarX family gamma-butyrolactone biosynthesis protein n=1 Tax=Kitasatospora sp. NPDC056783 TaxID=3345943 RepID=UPI00368E423F